MPPRKRTKTRAQAHELEAFAEKYDIFTAIYGDPVAVVFQVMADSEDPEVKLRAADMLMSYRYPRVKATEGAASNAPVLNFNVMMPNGQLAVAANSGQREFGVESGYAAARTLPAVDKSTDGLLDE